MISYRSTLYHVEEHSCVLTQHTLLSLVLTGLCLHHSVWITCQLHRKVSSVVQSTSPVHQSSLYRVLENSSARLRMFKRKWIASVWTLRTVDCTCVRTLRISWRGCVAILSMVTATETYRIKEESQWSNLVRVCETDCRKILLRNHLRNTCTQMFERSTVSWLRMRITRGVKCEVPLVCSSSVEAWRFHIFKGSDIP